MELIRRFTPEAYTSALESWSWLGGLATQSPVLANAFGDVFLQGEDGSFSFLDTIGGKLEHLWPDAAALQSTINTSEAQDEYLMAGLVNAAAEAGLAPGPDQVLSFKTAPILGGELAPSNLELTDFVVAVNLAGQIHEQVRSLPPGTPITGFTID